MRWLIGLWILTQAQYAWAVDRWRQPQYLLDTDRGRELKVSVEALREYRKLLSPDPNRVVEGWGPFGAPENEAGWRIKVTYVLGGVTFSTFADQAQYTQRWDQAATIAQGLAPVVDAFDPLTLPATRGDVREVRDAVVAADTQARADALALRSLTQTEFDQTQVLQTGTNSRLDTGNASLASIDGKVATAANQIQTNNRLDTVNTNLVTVQNNQATQTTQLTAINANTDDLETRLGPVTETAPGSDTASSGLNGRLQRLSQRLTSILAQLDVPMSTRATESTLSTRASEATLATRASEATLSTRATESTLATRATETTAQAVSTRVGPTDETAAATDTSTSGLNGLLKRIAQRLSTLISFYASDFGVSTGAIRTAAQVGNATGAANFGAGTTTAQTLRTVTNLHDGSANALTSTAYDSARPLQVYVMQYGATTATHTRFTINSNISTLIAPARASRKWLIISNSSGAEFFIRFVSPAIVNQGISIPNNTNYTMSTATLYTGDVYAIVGSNNRTIEVIEGF